MAENMTYNVTYKRDDNETWFVRAAEIPGAHSYGRTIASARHNIKEAIALVLDLEPGTEADMVLDEHIEIPDAAVMGAINVAAMLRKDAHDVDHAARRATFDALLAYRKADLNLSVRDLADMLGISFQRVQQLLTEIAQLEHTEIRAGRNG